MSDMNVLLVQPESYPKAVTIGSDLESLQAAVGGSIEVVYPFADPVALICNDEGKLLGLQPNRALYSADTGGAYDVVVGTFFLCGAPAGAEDFASLTDEQMQKYKKRFFKPEWFVNMGGCLLAIPSHD